MSDKKQLPHLIIPFTKEENELIEKNHNVKHRFIHVGEKGYCLPEQFLSLADWLCNFPLRSNDIFVVAFPRSGSTWVREMVWLIGNQLNFEKAKLIPIEERVKFLQIRSDRRFMDAVYEWQDAFASQGDQTKEKSETTQEQRFIITHLPLSLLPTDLLNTCKVVYVARDMRDVAVSRYLLSKVFKPAGLQTDNFKTYYEELFSKDLVKYCPFFEHVKEGWELRDHPNMLFLLYEELSKDLKTAAKRAVDFLGKTYTDQQLDLLCDHLKFENFQNNPAVDLPLTRKAGRLEEGKNYIRKGKVGGWRDYFDEEMTRHAENWISRELEGTGLDHALDRLQQ